MLTLSNIWTREIHFRDLIYILAGQIKDNDDSTSVPIKHKVAEKARGDFKEPSTVESAGKKDREKVLYLLLPW